ncbi:MAG: hypothetical protein R2875_18205 [Desulfobacterales bacterium]
MKFSGKVLFVDTRMRWRINHEVAPAKDALSYFDCHRPDGVMDFKKLGHAGILPPWAGVKSHPLPATRDKADAYL